MKDNKNTDLIQEKTINSSSITKALLSSCVLLSMAVISTSSFAASPVEYTQQDWQVVCDNTRTCRMAGYQADPSSDFPASIMLTRKAGSKAEVTGEIKLGGDKKGSNKALLTLGDRHRVSLYINNEDLGATEPSSLGEGYAKLTRTQVAALITALPKSSKIELVVRNSSWQVSDKGAKAVMLRADAAQDRTGTLSALINPKDFRSNNSVAIPEALPLLTLVTPNQLANVNSNKSFSLKSSQLSAMMQGSIKESATDCPKLASKTPWRVNRLNSTQLLAQHSCWSGAYNMGEGMWVINDSSPYNPKLVTTSATNYDNGTISSIQKGRNIGDCLATTQWVWTGKAFVKSYEDTTGLCRSVAAGGAWKLPTYVTEIKR